MVKTKLRKILSVIIQSNKKICFIIFLPIFFCSCSIKWEPWKVVWYYEKNLYKHNENPISGHPQYPKQSEFNSKKYHAYYIDNVFVGITSDKPRQDFEYERNEYFYVKITMDAYDKKGIEKIIIHNIKIISKSKIDYTPILNETFPIEIPVDGKYAEKLESEAIIFRFHDQEDIYQLSPNWLFIEYRAGEDIKFKKTEVFYVFVELELIKTAGSVKKEIKLTMKPKISRGLTQWEASGWSGIIMGLWIFLRH